jgi:hypothetical protein
MKRNQNGNLPTCLSICPTFPADDDERWKAAQIADAKRGKYWGKHGLRLMHIKLDLADDTHRGG